MSPINNPNHLEHMMSLDTNGTGARTVKRTTNVQPVPSYIELRTVVSSEMLPHPPATPLYGSLSFIPLLLLLIRLLSPVSVFDKIFPNRPTPDEDN